MKALDRVKVLEDYKLPNGFILVKDTVALCREINNFNCTIQFAMSLPDEEESYKRNFLGINPFKHPQFSSNKNSNKKLVTQAIVPDLILDLISQEDLDKYLNEDKHNYEYITSQIYHIDNFWSVKVGYDEFNNEIYKAGVIVKYNVKQNENDDTIVLHFLEDIENYKKSGKKIEDHIYKKRYLERFGSYSVIL